MTFPSINACQSFPNGYETDRQCFDFKDFLCDGHHVSRWSQPSFQSYWHCPTKTPTSAPINWSLSRPVHLNAETTLNQSAFKLTSSIPNFLEVIAGSIFAITTLTLLLMGQNLVKAYKLRSKNWNSPLSPAAVKAVCAASNLIFFHNFIPLAQE